MTPDSPEASLSLRRTLRAVLIAAVIGISLGIVLLFGTRALRTSRQDAQFADMTPALRGTADHWKRIPNIGNLIDIQILSDGSTWAVFGGDAIGRLDNGQWTQMPDQVTGDTLIALPGNAPALLVTGQTRAAWRTADRGTSWQAVDLGDAFAGLKTSLWPVSSTAGQLWLVSGTAVTQMVHDTWTSVAAPPGMNIVQSHSVLAARDGSLWATLSVSASGAASGATTPTPQKPMLWHYSVGGGWLATSITPRADVPILEDSQGGLWVALDNGGSAHFDGKAWLSFTLAAMGGPPTLAADDGLELRGDRSRWRDMVDGYERQPLPFRWTYVAGLHVGGPEFRLFARGEHADHRSRRAPMGGRSLVSALRGRSMAAF